VSFLGALRARWVTLRARWVTLRACWVTLRARWVTLRACWVTLRARWVTLRARWVTFSECVVDLSSVQRWLRAATDTAREGRWLEKAGLAVFYIVRLLALTVVMLLGAVRVRGVLAERQRAAGGGGASTLSCPR
jgi:hypothetical protein